MKTRFARKVASWLALGTLASGLIIGCGMHNGSGSGSTSSNGGGGNNNNNNNNGGGNSGNGVSAQVGDTLVRSTPSYTSDTGYNVWDTCTIDVGPSDFIILWTQKAPGLSTVKAAAFHVETSTAADDQYIICTTAVTTMLTSATDLYYGVAGSTKVPDVTGATTSTYGFVTNNQPNGQGTVYRVPITPTIDSTTHYITALSFGAKETVAQSLTNPTFIRSTDFEPPYSGTYVTIAGRQSQPAPLSIPTLYVFENNPTGNLGTIDAFWSAPYSYQGSPKITFPQTPSAIQGGTGNVFVQSNVQGQTLLSPYNGHIVLGKDPNKLSEGNKAAYSYLAYTLANADGSQSAANQGYVFLKRLLYDKSAPPVGYLNCAPYDLGVPVGKNLNNTFDVGVEQDSTTGLPKNIYAIQDLPTTGALLKWSNFDSSGTTPATGGVVMSSSLIYPTSLLVRPASATEPNPWLIITSNSGSGAGGNNIVAFDTVTSQKGIKGSANYPFQAVQISGHHFAVTEAINLGGTSSAVLQPSRLLFLND